jgi:hypothetical protein
METEPVPQPELEARPPSKRFPWLAPVIGLLAILIVWLLADALLFNRRIFYSYSEKDRLSDELTRLRVALGRDGITPEQAQTKLDSLAREYTLTASKKEFDRVQWMIDAKREERPFQPDSALKHPEWPMILSMPPPEDKPKKSDVGVK